ncbi:MAG: hypothetical protein EOO46_06450 [Flavobacterium sp.]|nr:MAG: hypothetical protein EOO46_06450 [Flavobacterium sp.]
MKQVTFMFFFALLFIGCGRHAYNKNKSNVSIDKLHGDWTFVRIYGSAITEVDTLTKELGKTAFISRVTYNEDGTYIFKNCYRAEGKYNVNKENYIIKETQGSDAVIGRITYLDDSYLLILFDEKTSPITYFYKRD